MVPTPQQLEVAAHSLIAVLGLWLGLTVLSRSGALAARIFAFLSLSLVVWSCAIILQRLSSSVPAVDIGRAIEEMAGALIVPATAHLSLAIATEGHPTGGRHRLIGVLYVLSVLFALPGIVNPAAPIQLALPNLSLGPVPGVVLGWAWIAYRLGTLSIGAVWLLDAFRGTQPADPRRRQLGVTLATVVVAAVGGSIRFLPVVGQTDPWIGVSLVTLAMILSASVVFSAGVFFAPEVAGKAFWTSLALGLGLFLLVGALLAVDAASRRLLGLDLPLLTIMALVVTIALYEPAATWLRARLSTGRSPAIGSRAPADGPRPADAHRAGRRRGRPAGAHPDDPGAGPAGARWWSAGTARSPPRKGSSRRRRPRPGDRPGRRGRGDGRAASRPPPVRRAAQCRRRGAAPSLGCVPGGGPADRSPGG